MRPAIVTSAEGARRSLTVAGGRNIHKPKGQDMENWRSWADTPTYFEHPEICEGRRCGVGSEEYRRAMVHYGFAIRRRISWLLANLPRPRGRKRAHAHYVLAVLHYRIGAHPRSQKARAARLHAIRAVRMDETHHRAWNLLAELYDLLAAESGVGYRLEPTADGRGVRPAEESLDRDGLIRQAKLQRRWAEKAVRYAQRALALDRGNEQYRYTLQLCAEMRNEAYADLEALRHCGPQW